MPSCLPSVAKVSTLCFIILLRLSLLQSTLSTKGPVWPEHRDVQPPLIRSASSNNETSNKLICTPFGACEPCPPQALNQPYCRPFGNRRLVHCTNGTEDHTNTPNSPPHPPAHHPESSSKPERDSPNHPAGEVLAWESCGRIVPKERADFYEFVACNVIFALVSLVVLFFRSRKMQVMQARQIAARIGIFRERGRT